MWTIPFPYNEIIRPSEIFYWLYSPQNILMDAEYSTQHELKVKIILKYFKILLYKERCPWYSVKLKRRLWDHIKVQFNFTKVSTCIYICMGRKSVKIYIKTLAIL